MFPNSKAPGNDGLTADFYEGFWNLLYSYELCELSNSQKQAIIR